MKRKGLCNGCDGRCCGLRVELTTYDIGQITASVSDMKEPFVDMIRAGPGRVGFRLNDEYWRLVMRRRNGRCVFFDKDSDLHCKIYKSRPAICRSYPFKITERGIKRINRSGCPRVIGYEWKYDQTYPQKIMDAEEEFSNYQEIIDGWNRNAKGTESFEDFIGFAYRKMEQRDGILDRIKENIKRIWKIHV